MNYLLVADYVSTAFATTWIPLNLLFFKWLYNYRQKPPFTSSFFELCRVLTLADVAMMIFSTLFFKLPVYGLIPPNVFQGKFSGIPIMGINYFSHVQAIGIIGIALNRSTAVFSPVRHRDYWWKPVRLRIFVIFMWLLPILTIIPLCFLKFEVVANNDGVVFAANNNSFNQWYFLGIAILDGVFINIFVGLIYLIIFLKIRTHIHIKKPKELTLRLASSAFLIFVCYSILGLFSLLSALTPSSNPWMYRSIWFIVNDILCSTNVPILLALNRPIRKKFLKMFDVSANLAQKSSLLN